MERFVAGDYLPFQWSTEVRNFDIAIHPAIGKVVDKDSVGGDENLDVFHFKNIFDNDVKVRQRPAVSHAPGRENFIDKVQVEVRTGKFYATAIIHAVKPDTPQAIQ